MVLLLLGAMARCCKAEEAQQDVIRLRAWGVPPKSSGAGNLAKLRVLEKFQEKFPYIKPVSTTGIKMPGGKTQDMVPLMQIAGDIPPHVMLVVFRNSDTYIQNKFLYPLDKYIETPTRGQPAPVNR